MKHVSSKIGPGFFEGLIQFSNKHPQPDKQRISAALAMGLVLLLTGFAITLLIGVLTSMFTAIVITRVLLKLFIGTGIARKISLFYSGSRGHHTDV